MPPREERSRPSPLRRCQLRGVAPLAPSRVLRRVVGVWLVAALQLPKEAYIWSLALIALAWTDPAAPPLVDICLLKHIGIWCPGCGLGHSIAFLLDGQWLRSWNAHVLGLPAALVLGGRVTSLLFMAKSSILHYTMTQRYHITENRYPCQKS